MTANLLRQINSLIWRFQQSLFGHGFPPGTSMCLAEATCIPSASSSQGMTPSLKDLIGDGFLWAVPRNRRTVEKRWKRRFGYPELSWKLLVPKTNLKLCTSCGTNHEVGVLCPKCYAKVKEETQNIQDQIQLELGLSPVDQNVIVLYDGEKSKEPPEFWMGKRIVEMKKPRPQWFCNSLTQKTTQPPATTKEVKPNDLG